MLVEFTLGIGSNLLTDLIKHGGRRFLDGTQLGAKLKEKLGLLDNTTEEEFKKLLLETYIVYFSRHPDRQFQVFYDFFSSEDVSKSLFDYVFNFQPVSYSDLEKALQNKMGKDWILFSILERENLTTQKVIEEFIKCYSDSEKKSAGVGFLLMVREIRQSEQRIVEKTSATLKETSEVVNSVVGGFAARLVALENELKRIGVNTKDIPSFDLLGKDAQRVQLAIHELRLLESAIIATAENSLINRKDINRIPKDVRSHIEELINFTRMLDYLVLNMLGFVDVAGYYFRPKEIDAIINDSVKMYKARARFKNIKIEVKLQPRHQTLELSEPIQLAFNNILNNAVKFSYSGTAQQLQKVTISGERTDSIYKLTVKNFGVGILLEEQKKIFEDGYKGKLTRTEYRSGIGRGLYVSKAVIERHHGKINVSSEKQNGGYITLFEVFLPYKQPVQSEDKNER